MRLIHPLIIGILGQYDKPDTSMNPPILPYQNFLSIGHIVKPVPYPGNSCADKGNRGFKQLKGKTLTEIIAAVPEAAQDQALASILNDINSANSALFSIGCSSADVLEPSGGCRVWGYVEFAINDKRVAKDITAYFQIFIQFAALLSAHFNQKMQFIWILQGAHFNDAGLDGLSCWLDMNTHEHPNKEAARDCWNKSLEALRACLKGVLYLKLNGAIITNFDRIY
jgi:hypothetical protein